MLRSGRWSGLRVLETSAEDRGDRGGAHLVFNWAERRSAVANCTAELWWPGMGEMVVQRLCSG